MGKGINKKQKEAKMDKIYQVGIYRKGYKKPDMTRAFYFGMNLDSVFNYIGITTLIEEEEIIDKIEVEVSHIENDEVEIKKVIAYTCFINDKIEVVIPFRVYEVKKINYIYPFK